MTPIQELQKRIRLYLLGRLSDGAGEELEQNMLTNAELFEELLVVEDELIDEYLAGKLDQNERASFEQHFLSTPERHEQLRFAQALNRYVTVASQRETAAAEFWPASKSRPTFLFRMVSAIAVVTLITGMVWFILHRSSTPETFATLNLTISQSTRGEGAQAPKIKIPLSEDALKIVLRLPDRSPTAGSYRVELESDNGQNRSLKTFTQDGQSVTVVIPAGELKLGQYSLKLFAVGADGAEQRSNGNYFFTVE